MSLALETINISDYETTSAMAAAVLPSLARREVYQRGGQLVHVAREPRIVGGQVETGGAPRIRQIPTQILTNEIAESATWVKVTYSKDGDAQPTPVDPPKDVIATIKDAGQWAHIRPLRGIAHWPVVSSDGIALADGYDAGSRYLLCGLPEISLPASPTQADAQAAAAELLTLVADFPIDSEAGRSAWLAGVLTLIARPGIDGPVPGILYDATTPGTGKTLAAMVSARIVTGCNPPVTGAPTEGSEWSRTLLSYALKGAPVVLLDNLRGKLDSPQLEAVLTSAKISERLLRSNDAVDADVQALFLLTGNGVEPTIDLARRCLHVRMVPQTERPELRGGFKFPRLQEHVQRHRGELLRLALIILHAHRCAGSPSVAMRPMGSFEAWSDAVRAPIIWAGCADPGETQDALRECASGDLDDHRELLEAWRMCFGGRCVTVSDARKAVVQNADDAAYKRLGAALLELCEVTEPSAATTRLIGARLKRLQDRVVGQLRLVRGKKGEDGYVWQVLSLADSHESAA
jgi:hypothetical protein